MRLCYKKKTFLQPMFINIKVFFYTSTDLVTRVKIHVNPTKMDSVRDN